MSEDAAFPGATSFHCSTCSAGTGFGSFGCLGCFGRADRAGRATRCASEAVRSLKSLFNGGRWGASTVAASMPNAPIRDTSAPAWKNVTVCRKKNTDASTAVTEANWSTDSDPTRNVAVPSLLAARSAAAATGSRMPIPV